MLALLKDALIVARRRAAGEVAATAAPQDQAESRDCGLCVVA
jgi:hypothetical protein